MSNEPTRTVPWSDRELLWVGRTPYCYRSLLGVVVAVHLPGQRIMQWSTFLARYPSVRGPREVRQCVGEPGGEVRQ